MLPRFSASTPPSSVQPERTRLWRLRDIARLSITFPLVCGQSDVSLDFPSVSRSRVSQSAWLVSTATHRCFNVSPDRAARTIRGISSQKLSICSKEDIFDGQRLVEPAGDHR